MSEAMCCPLTGNDEGDAASCHTESTRTARKEHRCCECREAILKGARYEYQSGIWDGEPSSFKTCLSCVEIRDHFACDGYLFGQLWCDLEENFFPDMRAGGKCLDGLSPEAKGRMFDKRLQWVFRSEREVDGAPPPGGFR